MTNHAPPTTGEGEPVTLIMTRRVKPGRAADDEARPEAFQQEARGLPCDLGVIMQRPAPGARHLPIDPRQHVT